MKVSEAILLRMFGRPHGLLGRIGGIIMARMNDDAGAWVTDLLEIRPDDAVLEVGFGPGVVVQHLSTLADAGYVAGVDASPEMVEQARARNAGTVGAGRVDLRQGSVESLPFEDGAFDKALAINSMQVWQDPTIGLKELQRVIKPDGRLALGFTRYSRQSEDGIVEALLAASFAEPRLVHKDKGFCALATSV